MIIQATTSTPLPFLSPTSQPNVSCPSENPDTKPDLTAWENDIWSKGDPLVDLMNSGVSPEVLIHELSKEVKKPEKRYFHFDLTGDETPELIVSDASLLILGCNNGKYRTLIAYDPSFKGFPSFPKILLIEDLNDNGIPDLVIVSYASTHGYRVVQILEWNGLQFVPLIRNYKAIEDGALSQREASLTWYSFDPSRSNDEASDYGTCISLDDLDGNGFKELILPSEVPGHFDTLCNWGPWREYKKTYVWNGEYYMYAELDLAPPIFRFQAVQEGDRYSILGNYDEAQRYYQEAIFNDQLQSFSEVRKFEMIQVCGNTEADIPDPPSELDDTEDYYLLSAYARYRLMLLHILRGWDNDAGTVYKTIFNSFPPGHDGYIVAEISQRFWDTYEAFQDVGLACENVTEFIVDHKDELLPVLGDSIHGSQSHQYTETDICPFK